MGRPISVAICAGGGRPFGCKSCLEVLRLIHVHGHKVADDSRAVNALHRDGNVLESFGGIVMMSSSWAEPRKILANLSLHCGRDLVTSERRQQAGF
mmetsp:Transcript_41964/g.132293  ORF Transcript_41964/g.132293 Transcript_41964/m.132293 type:complete len:96 (+) Transcript_41964:176-463(+)